MAEKGGKRIYWEKSSDFEEHFDPDAYVGYFYSDVTPNSWMEKLMTDFHSTFSSDSMSGCRLLDIGSGPCIHSVISASRTFSEIHLSDYTTGNRQALQDWRDKNHKAHDWTPFLQKVASLEGEDVGEIEARVRKSITRIIPCDVLSDTILSDTGDGLYDCVVSSACLEGACLTYKSYKSSVQSIANLLTDSGHVVVFSFIGDEHYDVGDKRFGCLYLTMAQIEEAFKEAGFRDVKITVLNYTDEMKEKYGEEEVSAGVITLHAHK